MTLPAFSQRPTLHERRCDFGRNRPFARTFGKINPIGAKKSEYRLESRRPNVMKRGRKATARSTAKSKNLTAKDAKDAKEKRGGIEPRKRRSGR